MDTIVVGGGLMGAAAARHLARRGVETLLLEQYEPAASRGSSHGSARITRRAYVEDDYVRLTGEAFEWWRELEIKSGATLLTVTGGLDFGFEHDPLAIAESLGRAHLCRCRRSGSRNTACSTSRATTRRSRGR